MDWEKIKAEYITTDTSYAKLAKKYGTTKGAIGNRAVREKWYEQRKTYINETLTATLEIAKADGAKEIVKSCSGEISQARVLAELAAVAFARGTDYAQIRVGDDGKYRVDFTETDALTDAQKAAVTGIELTQTGPKVKTADKLRALELLAKYTGLVDSETSDDDGTGVVVLPEIGE